MLKYMAKRLIEAKVSCHANDEQLKQNITSKNRDVLLLSLYIFLVPCGVSSLATACVFTTTSSQRLFGTLSDAAFTEGACVC